MTNVLVILLSVLVFALCCWLEFRRANKKRLALRISASFLLVASITCLFLEPKYPTKNTGKKSMAEAVFLTPGFDKDSLAAFGDSVRYYASDEKLIRQNRPLNIKPVFDAEDLQAENGIVQIIGSGLDEDELALLKNHSVTFHPTQIKEGVTDIFWTKKIRTGEALTIAGNYVHSGKTPVKLVLEGMGQRLDSQLISAQKNRSFKLQSRPKISGKGVYKIMALSGKDTLESAPVPFEVEPKRTLNVLMLASAPGFENRFLKNWLAAEGYGLALQSNISKGKTTQEFLNTGKVSLGKMTPALLQKFDVLIADAEALKQLSGAENSVLKSAVEKNGLGLIIKADSASTGSRAIKRAFPVSAIQKNGNEGKLFLAGKNGTIQLAGTGLDIKLQPGVQPLIHDAQKHTLAAVALAGNGKQVFSTLGETYTLMLSGDKNSYHDIWTLLIGQAAKRVSQKENIWVEEFIAVKNKPAHIFLETSAAGLPQVSNGDVRLAIAQSLQLPYRWSGFYWPQKSGWHQLRTKTGSLFWHYFFSVEDFIGVQAKLCMLTTQNFSDRQKTGVKTASTENNWIRKPVPLLIFFAIMLISWAFLWIERKLS